MPLASVGVFVAAFQVPWNTKPAGIVPTKFCTNAVVAIVVLSVAFTWVVPVVALPIVPSNSPWSKVALTVGAVIVPAALILFDAVILPVTLNDALLFKPFALAVKNWLLEVCELSG